MRWIYCILCLLLSSCVYKTPDVIIVKGNVRNIPATKLYLTDAYKWQTYLDSADYRNDTFSFHISPKNFRPYLASIYFIDSTGKRKVLGYQNYILSTSQNKYGLTAFVLDRGVTNISGTFILHMTAKTDKLKITGSKQNTPYFKTQLSNFGWINTKDEIKRKEVINNYKNLIREYPYSYYFIRTLYDYRFQYSKGELTDMLSLFNNDRTVQYFQREFNAYFKQMPSPGVPLHNYAFKDSLNRPENIISDSSKLNMIIFWASWCGPCRKEIPELKRIYEQFRDHGIHTVSISIDKDQQAWRTALKNEHMDWEQLVVDPSLLDQVENSFNFNDIPLIVFTNEKGVEINRFVGYDPDRKGEYQKIINKYSLNE